MLSGGYYKSSIHRVTQPAQDQRGHKRLSVLYFGYADDDVRLEPLSVSPVLQRVGMKRRVEEGQAPLMEDWRKEWVSSYGTSELKKARRKVLRKKNSTASASGTTTKAQCKECSVMCNLQTEQRQHRLISAANPFTEIHRA